MVGPVKVLPVFIFVSLLGVLEGSLDGEDNGRRWDWCDGWSDWYARVGYRM